MAVICSTVAAAVQIRRSSKLCCENSLAVGYPIGLIIDGEKGNTPKFAANGDLKLSRAYNRS